MDTQKSLFNRLLLVILVILYLASIAAINYLEWSADPGREPLQWWTLFLRPNVLIMSIPLILLYGSIYVLVVAWREHTAQGQINPRLANIVHWLPRIAAILIILFISLFSFDVFEMPGTPLELLGGFLIHNLPSFGLLALLIFAWKRPAIGFVAFLAAAILLTITVIARSPDALPGLLFFALPILLIAGLFYADWRWIQPLQPAT